MADIQRDDPRFLRFGALSMLGNAVIVLLVWLLFFWVGGTSRLSGVNAVHGWLIRLTSAIPATIIVTACLALARQLLGAAREARAVGTTR
ncbi:MAG TPA: hypothetical protein VFS08_05090 [Gemmatimonadaceae bacterium]|nr:hypothetical protein [Gemmatimonadaceae bacterium]